jgi:hypothetical protein
LSVDGLLTLIKSAYGVLNKHNKTYDTYRSLSWRLHFHGDVHTLADPGIHHFHLLQHQLRNGQTGWFEGSNASFRFSVVEVHAGEISPNKLSHYPKIAVARTPRSFSPVLKDDWLSSELKVRATEFRHEFKEYMGGANIWGRDASGDYFRHQPNPPKWTPKEEGILSVLVLSGYKFQESWLGILQYAFVKRSEVGTAQQWYKVRKKQVSDSSDREHSKEDMIVQAKHSCLDLLQGYLKAGVPQLPDHPLKRKNEVLAESFGSNILLGPKRRRVSFTQPLELGDEPGRYNTWGNATELQN